jgi:hypothetical protein
MTITTGGPDPFYALTSGPRQFLQADPKLDASPVRHKKKLNFEKHFLGIFYGFFGGNFFSFKRTSAALLRSNIPKTVPTLDTFDFNI